MKHAAVVALLLAATVSSAGLAQAQRLRQVDLVSDLSGQALHTDSHLVNPWGLVPGPTGIFWVSNNGTGTSTLYDPDGTAHALVVTIPGGHPTGVALAAASDSSFRIPSADTTARAIFIFVTEGGTIAAWTPNVTPSTAIQVASVSGARYTGVTILGPAGTPHLYAANFGAGTIDVFDRDFQKVNLSGNFTDPNLPANYTPFNVAAFDGQLFVAYAQTANHQDETHGPGLGIVDIFDLNGNFLHRLVSPGGALNAPWGMVVARPGFAGVGGALLVGNLGDGHINAFDASSGSSMGAMQDSTGAVLAIPGLWGLAFGAPASGAAVAGRLYFAAGIQDENHGLFGFLTPFTGGGGGGGGGGPVPPTCVNDPKGFGFWRQVCMSSEDGSFPRGQALDFGDHGDNGRKDGHGKGHGHGHGHGPFGPGGISADSLTALLGCISSQAGAFGSGGCFTAGCDLLRKVGRRTERTLAAQQLLALRLNLCSGLVCDSAAIGCGAHVQGEGGGPMTVGELADSLDVLLCHGGSSTDIRRMTDLVACVNGGADDNDVEELRDLRPDFSPRITVRTFGAAPAKLGGDPVRLSLSASTPSIVQLRIYDAAGRLVAEPMRNAFVSGTVEVQWNGRSMRGDLVSPGNYFYRVTSGSEASTGRIVIIR